MLKGTPDFLTSDFFSSKAPTRSPDSYPKFISNIKSNSPRYSNYSSLCFDSVNVELFFASSYITLQAFYGWYWPHLNISRIIFLHPIPLKAPELGMYACFCLISLPHTESTQNKTSRQLSQCGVRLHVNWVNSEWDFKSTESTPKAPTFRTILSFHVDPVDVESHSMLTQSTWSLTWRWLSWRGMRLGINWVNAKC
jgi:hypothetical protein